MDMNNSFASYYPNYFNQTGATTTWPSNSEGHEAKAAQPSQKFKQEDDIDYHALVESMLSGLDRAKGAAARGDAKPQPASPLETRVKNINWSDFDDNYLAKSLTRQFAKTTLTPSQPDLTHLQADWQAKSPKRAAGANMANLTMLSRMLDEGYETKLNSSRSENSTNRTNLPGAGAVPLPPTLGYNGITGATLINNSLINQQLLTQNLGMGLNQSLTHNLGNNLGAQLMRNHLINNHLLNRQILNSQLINSQILASPNLFSNPNMATFRGTPYDYLANAKLGAEYAPGDLVASDYLQANFNPEPKGLPLSMFDYNFGHKFKKGQFGFKNAKNRPVRKKRAAKGELFPLPSLKEGDLEKAVEYLRETLLSLYRDQIMPIYFNVRGRFIEFNADKIAPEHIMGICNRRPDVFNVVSNGVLNETFIYLVDEPAWFTAWVDRNDMTDTYGADMWRQFFAFIKGYRDEEGNEHFPGSIYGMSRVMQKLELPFLAGMSLGTICHIVQLAIRLKKYLVYDLKTLKPSEAVRNGDFEDGLGAPADAEAAPAPEAPAAA